jgi:hypothetical protein
VCSRGEKLSIGAEFVFGGQHCDSFDKLGKGCVWDKNSEVNIRGAA